MREPLSRASVLESARRILVDEGLDAVSLRRVASALGVTAPALYAYVKDKQDLLRGIVEIELDGLKERFGAVRDPDPWDRLRSMAHTYVEFARDNPSVFRTMFLSHPDLAAEAPREGTEPLVEPVFEQASRPLQELARRHELGEMDPQFAALTFWTAVHGAAALTVAGRELRPGDRGRAADEVVETVITGLRRRQPAGAG